jgi:hypothetical protein
VDEPGKAAPWQLTALIEGRRSTALAKDEMQKLAIRLIAEEALEWEVGDTVGRNQ